jgi:hypothetical protein
MKPPALQMTRNKKGRPQAAFSKNLRAFARTKSYLRGAIPPKVTRLSAPSLATAATPMK